MHFYKFMVMLFVASGMLMGSIDAVDPSKDTLFLSKCPCKKNSKKKQRCCRGHHGARGHHGRRGHHGPQGPQGIPGESAGPFTTPAFANVYFTVLAAPSPTVAPGDFIPFQSIASSPVGIDTSSLIATGELIIEQAGIYLVNYSVTLGIPLGSSTYPVSVDIAVNGVAVGDGQSGVVLIDPTGTDADMVSYLSGQRTFTFAVGDRIKIINSAAVGGNALLFRTGSTSIGMQQATAATFTIQKLQ